MGLGAFQYRRASAPVSTPTSRLRRMVRVALQCTLLFAAASTAQAAPYIPFDAPEQTNGFSYGFLNPANYGISSYRTMDNFYQAASSSTPEAANSLLHVDPVSFERCPRSSDDCDSDFHVFDIEWDITFNADILDDPSLAYNVDLILVDSDPSSDFDGNTVAIDYASATLDDANLGFETANFGNGAFYFLDLALGSMMNGETKRVGFTYQVEGELPLGSGGDVGFLFPVILPGAYLEPVPEPGTAMLFAVGLVGLAMRHKWA